MPKRPDVTQVEVPNPGLTLPPNKAPKRDNGSDMDHMGEINTLKEKIISLEKQISAKNRELIAKDQEITQMKAKVFNEEKLIREKMKKMARLHEEKLNESSDKVRSLQNELAKLRKSENNSFKRKSNSTNLFQDKTKKFAKSSRTASPMSRSRSRSKSPGTKARSRSGSRSQSPSVVTKEDNSRVGSPLVNTQGTGEEKTTEVEKENVKDNLVGDGEVKKEEDGGEGDVKENGGDSRDGGGGEDGVSKVDSDNKVDGEDKVKDNVEVKEEGELKEDNEPKEHSEDGKNNEVTEDNGDRDNV